MKTEHTSTPWRYQGWDNSPEDRGAYILGGGPAGSAEEHMVGAALPQPTARNRAECEANARLIVRAVNAHDALIDAIESRAVEAAQQCGLGISEWRSFLTPKETAALALAQKESD